MRLEQTADDEGFDPGRSHERHLLSEGESTTLGEFAGEDDGARVVQKDERIVEDIVEALALIVESNVRLVTEIDAVHGQQLPAVVVGERDPGHERDGELDAAYARGSLCDLFQERRVVTGRDRQGGASPDSINRVEERLQHGRVHQPDGDDQRHTQSDRHNA